MHMQCSGIQTKLHHCAMKPTTRFNLRVGLGMGFVALAACASAVGTAPPHVASRPPFHLCAQIESEVG
jgi:hypothetical protein